MSTEGQYGHRGCLLDGLILVNMDTKGQYQHQELGLVNMDIRVNMDIKVNMSGH